MFELCLRDALWQMSCTGKCCNGAAEAMARVVQMPFSLCVNFAVCGNGVS